MPNILLTQRCVRSCPYCFAKKHMGGADPGAFLPWEDLVYLADIMQEDKCMEMRFLGGEPTLHPAFADFAAYSLARGFSVTVFTSGIMAPKVKADIRRVFETIPRAKEKLSFLCNINDPAKSPPEEVPAVEDFLQEFGGSVTPGFNIYTLDFDLQFLFEYILRYGLKRNIRLGITHPILREDNMFIRPEDMRAMMQRLLGFLPQFLKLDVVPSLDCGFPLCALTDEELGRFHKAARGKLHFSCGLPLDIGPDMQVWSCFPLSAINKKSIYEFDTLKQAGEHFSQLMRNCRVEAGGIYPECDACDWRKKQLCHGGCAAHILKKIDEEGNIRALKLT